MSASPHIEKRSTASFGLAEAVYFGGSDHNLFGWLHRPAAAPTGIGLVICKPFGYEAICSHRSIRAFAEAAAKPPLDHVLEYTEDPIVSSDIVGSPASCTFDSLLTMVLPVNDALSMVKVHGWYDNEWGYSNRLVDLTVLVGG